MTAPPLWQVPAAPVIGGSGAFRRPSPPESTGGRVSLRARSAGVVPTSDSTPLASSRPLRATSSRVSRLPRRFSEEETPAVTLRASSEAWIEEPEEPSPLVVMPLPHSPRSPIPSLPWHDSLRINGAISSPAYRTSVSQLFVHFMSWSAPIEGEGGGGALQAVATNADGMIMVRCRRCAQGSGSAERGCGAAELQCARQR